VGVLGEVDGRNWDIAPRDPVSDNQLVVGGSFLDRHGGDRCHHDGQREEGKSHWKKDERERERERREREKGLI
jgi:hypothetical protein